LTTRNGNTSKPGAQTLRERFRRTMHFEKPDRLPMFEFGYWDETLPAWHEQGLPKSITAQWQAYEYFGIEAWAEAPVNQWLLPESPVEILEETDDHIIFRETDRVIKHETKGNKSIPHFIDFPIKKREDWAWYRERLDPNTPGRLPADFADQARALAARDAPVSVEFASLCGRLRNWMGFENYAMATLVEQEFLCEMMDDFVKLSVGLLEKAFAAGLKVDMAFGWEDITFNSGPIVHPDFFYSEVVPRYKKITSVLHRNGCDVIFVDSDGNINRLVDGWLDAGINCMFPLEVNGGTDPVALREKYDHRILLLGGVDKMKLAGSKDAILKELKRLQPVVEDGGFIPHVDHRCPPNVPLANYIYYLDAKRDLFGAGKLKAQYKM
jgi:hypothetical protein